MIISRICYFLLFKNLNDCIEFLLFFVDRNNTMKSTRDAAGNAAMSGAYLVLAFTTKVASTEPESSEQLTNKEK